MSYKLIFSLILINFADNFFFKHRFTPKFETNIKHNVEIITRTIICTKIPTRSERFSSCSYSILALEILVSVNVASSIIASTKRIIPDSINIFLIVSLFYICKSLYQLCMCSFFPWEIKSSLINSVFCLISSFMHECVSCIKLKPFAMT